MPSSNGKKFNHKDCLSNRVQNAGVLNVLPISLLVLVAALALSGCGEETDKKLSAAAEVYAESSGQNGIEEVQNEAKKVGDRSEKVNDVGSDIGSLGEAAGKQAETAVNKVGEHGEKLAVDAGNHGKAMVKEAKKEVEKIQEHAEKLHQHSFFSGYGEAAKGCSTKELHRLLRVDGKTGLEDHEVHSKGVKVCQVPYGLDGMCLQPAENIVTEVEVTCPFLFNVWELDASKTYGRGESIKSRKSMVARCSFEAEPTWCFTDYCHAKPVDCFTTEQSAEHARPWEQAGVATAKESKNASSTFQGPKSNSSLLEIHERSLPNLQHRHGGARKSTLQVTQHAFVVGRP